MGARALKAVGAAVLAACAVVAVPAGRDDADAASPRVVEYPGLDEFTIPAGLVAGPDQRIWFTLRDRRSDVSRPRVGAITPAGAITQYPMPHEVDGITVGPDNAIWMTGWEQDAGPIIVRTDLDGTATSYRPPGRDPQNQGDQLHGITLGPDGNLWYTRSWGTIGKLTPAGAFTEYPLPDIGSGGPGLPRGITAGPGGALWFSLADNTHIGRATVNGTITTIALGSQGATQFDAAESVLGTWPSPITAGPDGNLWLADEVTVARITPEGGVTRFNVMSYARSVAVGPDGNLWAGGQYGLTRITPAGAVTDFPVGYSRNVMDVAPGPDGRVWYSQRGDSSVRSAIAAIPTTPDPTGEFTALTPTRLLDTRDGTGRNGVAGPVGPGRSIDVQITGRGGVPTSGVSAVVVNTTVVGPTAASHLTVSPAGRPRPGVSNLNFVPGQTVPNLVTVAVGSGGRLAVYNNSGSTHVVMDVVGFYATGSGQLGSRFRPLDPARLFDTRYGSGGVPAQPVGPGGTLRFKTIGVGGVPLTGVTAVVMNVTVTGPTAASHLTVSPADVARPLASNLNFVAGQTVPNLVAVRVPPSGLVDFFNSAGSTHVLADIVGFYTTAIATNAGRFVPVTPTRLYDDRMFPESSFFATGHGDVQVAGRNGVPALNASAAVMNVTVTATQVAGHLTVYPEELCGQPPYASNLNFTRGQTVPNLVVTRLTTNRDICTVRDGDVSFFSSANRLHYIVDVFGYFTGPAFADHWS